MKRKKNNIIICKIKAMHVYLYYKKKEQENITSDKKKIGFKNFDDNISKIKNVFLFAHKYITI